uniref:Uncharacterized protein n=1 Tax=Anguilla anguilla TaxID=7936 RepID=A0A0E9RLI3_ANGAN
MKHHAGCISVLNINNISSWGIKIELPQISISMEPY